jgi:hypothetical protein
MQWFLDNKLYQLGLIQADLSIVSQTPESG